MNTANQHQTRRRTRDEQIADKKNAVVALRLLAADPLMPDARAAALMHSAAGLEREIVCLQAAQGEADERALLAAADSLPADLPVPFRPKGVPLPPDLVVPVTREPEHAFSDGGDGGGVHIDGGGGEGDGGGDGGDGGGPVACECCGGAMASYREAWWFCAECKNRTRQAGDALAELDFHRARGTYSFFIGFGFGVICALFAVGFWWGLHS